MRKVLIYCLLLLLILALFPAFATLISDKNQKPTASTATPDTEEVSKNTDNIINYALDIIDEDFGDDGIMAALAIAENNINYSIQNNKKMSDIGNSNENNEDLKQRVMKLYIKTDTYISYQNKLVYIPVNKLSAGYSKADEKYEYIISVASPWDCFNEDYVYNKEYSSGISMKGIDFLCKNGANYKEALKWYLPYVEIK